MPDLERIQQRTPGTLSQQWYEDGAVVDPGTVTVGITRADGTVLVAAGAATSGTSTAPRTYNLTTTHTALLDRLLVTWTSTLKGTLVSYVEVVGGFLFGIAEARALKPLDSVTNYTTAAIIDMRTTVEQALEEECGVAFVPRYTRETVNGPGTMTLLLKWPKVTAIRSALVGTTTLTSTDLAALTYGLGGVVGGYAWTAGIGNLTVGYEHGYPTPPAEIRRAALTLAKMWLVGQRSPIDDRAITFNTTDGGTYSLAVPGRNGSHFGHPDVDIAVDRYSLRVGVA
jgi:hypothetical protein